MKKLIKKIIKLPESGNHYSKGNIYTNWYHVYFVEDFLNPKGAMITEYHDISNNTKSYEVAPFGFYSGNNVFKVGMSNTQDAQLENGVNWLASLTKKDMQELLHGKQSILLTD